MKIHTSLITLMRLAGKLGEARKTGDKQEIENAERRHNEYRDICLRDDVVMDTGFTVGALSSNFTEAMKRTEY